MLGSIIIYAVKENIIEGIENVRQSVSVYFLFCIIYGGGRNQVIWNPLGGENSKCILGPEVEQAWLLEKFPKTPLGW